MFPSEMTLTLPHPLQWCLFRARLNCSAHCMHMVWSLNLSNTGHRAPIKVAYGKRKFWHNKYMENFHHNFKVVN